MRRRLAIGALLATLTVGLSVHCGNDPPSKPDPVAPTAAPAPPPVAVNPSPAPTADPDAKWFTIEKWWKYGFRATHSRQGTLSGKACVCSVPGGKQWLVATIPFTIKGTQDVNIGGWEHLFKGAPCQLQVDLTRGECACPSPIGGILAYHHYPGSPCPNPSPSPEPSPSPSPEPSPSPSPEPSPSPSPEPSPSPSPEPSPSPSPSPCPTPKPKLCHVSNKGGRDGQVNLVLSPKGWSHWKHLNDDKFCPPDHRGACSCEKAIADAKDCGIEATGGFTCKIEGGANFSSSTGCH